MRSKLWSFETPDKPGYYWHCCPITDPKVVLIYKHAGYLCIDYYCAPSTHNVEWFVHEPLEEFCTGNDMWAGPLRLPTNG